MESIRQPQPAPDRTLPDLAGMAAALAANNARTSRFIQSLSGRVERLLEAADRQDLAEVRRISETLVQCGEAYQTPGLAEAARQVCQALDQPHPAAGLRRSLVQLVGICRAAGGPRDSMFRPE